MMDDDGGRLWKIRVMIVMVYGVIVRDGDG